MTRTRRDELNDAYGYHPTPTAKPWRYCSTHGFTHPTSWKVASSSEVGGCLFPEINVLPLTITLRLARYWYGSSDVDDQTLLNITNSPAYVMNRKVKDTIDLADRSGGLKRWLALRSGRRLLASVTAAMDVPWVIDLPWDGPT